jgi:hypothetical protein
MLSVLLVGRRLSLIVFFIAVHLNSETSNNCPLILKLSMDLKGKCGFHFESFWPKLPGFMEEVVVSWDQPIQASCPIERVSMKFKRLARRSQSWGHKAVGNVSSRLGWLVRCCTGWRWPRIAGCCRLRKCGCCAN